MARRDAEDWLLDLGADLERLSHSTRLGAPRMARQRGWSPRVDVLESAANVLVRFELAGVRRDRIALTYHAEHNTLSVKGYRHDPLTGAEGLYAHRLEMEFGEFERVVELPNVDLSIRHAQTQFHGGVLLVSIPKEENVIVEHTVTIRKI
ncbi:MAG: Hsp20/alpha crystallin family protein [Fimbriimonadaceae bacterium]|nr:Hsp20/alpha crystallin family protein [Fimbriimonadaceae bacterium]